MHRHWWQMTWILVALMVWLEAPISGTSLNPTRSFGSALVSWFWHDQWIYYLAPPLEHCSEGLRYGSL